MKTIFVRFYDPADICCESDLTDDEVKKYCFRVNKYDSEFHALDAYANTMVTWSTILDDSDDVEAFIDEAYKRIKFNDYKWLEQNFT